MKYRVKQTEIKERLYLPNKKVVKEYIFNSYKEALRFCIFEQIDLIECVINHIDENGKKYEAITKRRPFKIYHSLPSFERVAKINPIHYIGTRFFEQVDLQQYYLYLFESGQTQKLRKH